MSKRKKYGNIYEIKMPNNKYAYLCLIRECGFGIFDYSSEIQTNNIQELLIKGLKIYKFERIYDFVQLFFCFVRSSFNYSFCQNKNHSVFSFLKNILSNV